MTRQNKAKLAIALAWVLLLLGFAAARGAEIPAPFRGKVTAVTDGDTIKVDGRSIRLEGIDAPELKQPFGRDGKLYVTSLALGKQASVKPVTVDRYGRIVARVKIGRADLSRKLVKEGMAWHFAAYSDDAGLAKLEAKARKKAIGLFITSDDDGPRPAPEAPWDYRRRIKAERAAKK